MKQPTYAISSFIRFAFLRVDGPLAGRRRTRARSMEVDKHDPSRERHPAGVLRRESRDRLSQPRRLSVPGPF